VLGAAIIFFVIGLVAIALGYGNVAGLSLQAGEILLGVFLVLAVLSFIISVSTGRRSGPHGGLT
jgi:uncharacterized membrane protein YtjA (UPF0391 family)